MEILKTEQFDRWLTRLKEIPARAAILARLSRVELAATLDGDFKLIEDGIYELRIHVGPGYRLYAVRQGSALLIMLAGGDKSTQRRDIKRARRLARAWKEMR